MTGDWNIRCWHEGVLCISDAQNGFCKDKSLMIQIVPEYKNRESVYIEANSYSSWKSVYSITESV